MGSITPCGTLFFHIKLLHITYFYRRVFQKAVCFVMEEKKIIFFSSKKPPQHYIQVLVNHERIGMIFNPTVGIKGKSNNDNNSMYK